MLSTHRLHLLNQFKLRGTLASVAEALSYSPSAISQQLAQLESEAGVKVFERSGRGLRLTPEGEILTAHAARILRAIEEAEADLATADAVRGDIRIATFQTAALSLMPALLTTVQGAHPELVIHFTVVQPDLAIDALLAHDFDLVLGEEYEGQELFQDPAVDRIDLAKDPLRIYVPSTLGIDAGRLGALGRAPWVMEPKGKPARAWAESLCRSYGFEPMVRFESDDLVVHERMVATGHAVAILPDLMSPTVPSTVEIVTAPSLPTRTIFHATRASSSGRPSIGAIRQALTASVSRA